MRDPYTVLGVGKQASAAEIKKAFRKLAKQYHPDRNADDPKAKDKFAEINTAYEVLGDAEKRGKFDRGEIDGDGKPRGFEGFPGGGGPGGYEGFSFGFGGGQNPFAGGARGGRGAGMGEDIFSHLFGEGMRGARQRPARGEDLAARLTLTIEQIARDEKQRISLPEGREVEVTVPPGVTDGQTIRLRGLGRPGQNGGEAGDVLLSVAIVPQDTWTIEGSDLRMRAPLDLADAVLGGKLRVRTPTGTIEMSVPPRTSSGRTFRLRGKGLPKRGGAGDLLVAVDVKLPEREDEALAAWAQGVRAKAE